MKKGEKLVIKKCGKDCFVCFYEKTMNFKNYRWFHWVRE